MKIRLNLFCRLVSLILPVTLAACVNEPAGAKASDPAVPENAIHVKGPLYMVPIGEDKGACTMYRTLSTEGASIAVIHYRKSDGTFVMDKSKSDCKI